MMAGVNPSRRGRLTLIAVGLALLSAWILQTAHWIAVPHRVCEVHGALEHGLAAEVSATPPGERARAPGSGARVEATYAASTARHEGCALGPFDHREALLPLVAARSFEPALEGRATAERPRDAQHSVPLLALAPSRSPPDEDA